MFYVSIIQSVVTFCITCYYGNLSKHDVNMIGKISRVANKLGVIANAFEDLYCINVRNMLMKIMKNPQHPLNMYIQWLPSRQRLRSILCKTKRYQMSFLPTAIHQHYSR